MIEKKTIIDLIEVRRSGEISVVFALQIVEGNTELAPSRTHRGTIAVTDDVDARIDAIDANLQSLGNAALDRVRMPQLRAIAAIVRGGPPQGSPPR
jgi:hypothetical protein